MCCQHFRKSSALLISISKTWTCVVYSEILKPFKHDLFSWTICTVHNLGHGTDPSAQWGRTRARWDKLFRRQVLWNKIYDLLIYNYSGHVWWDRVKVYRRICSSFSRFFFVFQVELLQLVARARNIFRSGFGRVVLWLTMLVDSLEVTDLINDVVDNCLDREYTHNVYNCTLRSR